MTPWALPGGKCYRYGVGVLYADHRQYLGKAVQVGPIKLSLKAPGTKHLKLKCGWNRFQTLLSISTCAAKSGQHGPGARDQPGRVLGRGLHSSTSLLNPSRFCH